MPTTINSGILRARVSRSMDRVDSPGIAQKCCRGIDKVLAIVHVKHGISLLSVRIVCGEKHDDIAGMLQAVALEMIMIPDSMTVHEARVFGAYILAAKHPPAQEVPRI